MSEMSDFERSLAGLTPKADLDRDHLLFQAGVRSAARRPRLAVPTMMLALGLALGGAGGWSLHEPKQTTIATAPEAAPEAPAPIEAYSYGRLQQRYLRGDFTSAVAFHQVDAPKSPPAESLGQQRGKLLQGDATP